MHNGRFQIIEVIEGFKLKERFLSNSLWVVFYRDTYLRGKRSEMSVSTPVHLYTCTPEIN